MAWEDKTQERVARRPKYALGAFVLVAVAVVLVLIAFGWHP